MNYNIFITNDIYRFLKYKKSFLKLMRKDSKKTTYQTTYFSF